MSDQVSILLGQKRTVGRFIIVIIIIIIIIVIIVIIIIMILTGSLF